jgi:rhodanese-related sulfurtransferase
MVKNLTTDPNQLKSINLEKDIILDVRTELEYKEKHIGLKHIHVPLHDLDPVDFIKRYNIKPVTVIHLLCLGGKRAEQAASKFIEAGHTAVKVITGGLIACEEYGHEIKSYICKSSCRPSVSLERQVRIIAGVCSIIGTILALFVNPLFSLVPLFVGAGLVFSGVTDFCGLALILAKAPWNKKKY